jgi:hypothetical protein
MPSKNIEELNELYREADEADQELFAEQKSNILLVSGEHYAKRGSKFWNRIRDTKDLTESQRLRLTKNHIQKITKTYINNLLSYAPGVTVEPRNPQELQDQKAAELHNSVLEDIKLKGQIKKKIQEWSSDYINIGEVALKLFWDPSAGKFIGYEAEMGEDGNPIVENGAYKKSERAVFSGDLVFERVFGFNLLRHPDAKSMDESPCLIIRKMVRIKELEARIQAENTSPEEKKKKLALLEPSKDETYTVFDGMGDGYKQVKDQAMLREFYYRPCVEYPNGYYYICIENGILWEGELPLGIFPIFYEGFDPVQTTPRCRSMIKQLRPYQAEINRAASKIAEHQITLGDDKLILLSGSKVSSGGNLPGIRALSVSGPAPQVLNGRSGDQYLGYMNSQISEMYQVANLPEEMQEKSGQFDPYSMLYQSMDQKRKFSLYSSKFQNFLISLMSAALEMKRAYTKPEDVIPMVGKNEQVNISEFKNMSELNYQIKIEAQSEDVESKFGKQLTLNHILQFVGPQLKPEDVGRLIKTMPYANDKELFSDLTIDYDNGTNVILALDRGEQVMINQYDNHPYMIKRLVNRMRQADFKFLDPQIQQMYQQVVMAHEQTQAVLLQQEKALQADMIPTGGYLVTLDVYVNDPVKPGVTKRARLPYESVVWLIKRLESQGTTLASLMSLQDAARGEIASIAQNRAVNPTMEPSMSSVSPQEMQGAAQTFNGQANPGG